MLNKWKQLKCVKFKCKSTNTATCKAAKRQQQQQIDSCSGVGNKFASFEESSRRLSQVVFFRQCFQFQWVTRRQRSTLFPLSLSLCPCVSLSSCCVLCVCVSVCCFWRERFLAAANGLRSMSQASHWTTATTTRRGEHGKWIGWITKPTTTNKIVFTQKTKRKKYEKY